MDVVANEEKVKYEAVWNFAAYRTGNPGLKSAAKALDALKMMPGESLMEYGCGNGRAAVWFSDHGLAVTMVDIARNAPDPEVRARLPFWEETLWNLPKRFPTADWAFCADVMEHLPPGKVGDALRGIRAHTRKGGFFQIAHFMSFFTGPNGEPLHLTVREPEWWEVRLSEHFNIVDQFRADCYSSRRPDVVSTCYVCRC